MVAWSTTVAQGEHFKLPTVPPPFLLLSIPPPLPPIVLILLRLLPTPIPSGRNIRTQFTYHTQISHPPSNTSYQQLKETHRQRKDHPAS